MSLHHAHTSGALRAETLGETLDRLTGLSLFSAAARRRHARYRESVAELQRLSDRDLADIGIMRCDIHRVAREASLGA